MAPARNAGATGDSGRVLWGAIDIHVHSLPDDRPRIAGLAPDSELGWTDLGWTPSAQ
jgi:hypothetical protein